MGAGYSTSVNKNNVQVSDLYLNNSYTDLSANNPFWNADENKPAFLGVNGELPTGSSPLIYLPMRADNAGANKGTGGDFSVTGTLEGARGPSEFWANSAVGDGSTGYLSSSAANIGATDSKQFTMVFKAKKPTAADPVIFVGNSSISSEYYSGDQFDIRLKNSSLTTIFNIFENSFNTPDVWHTVMISLDLSDPNKYHFYKNGNLISTTPSTYTNDTIDFNL